MSHLASVAETLRGVGAAFADFVFPRLCPGCGERVIEPRDALVCDACDAAQAEPHAPLCPVCGAPAAELGSGKEKCPSCPTGKLFLAAARAATSYAGPARSLVEKLKYHGRVEYAAFMARRMKRALDAEFGDEAAAKGLASFVEGGFHLALPVPLHATRRRERGFNQAEVLARQLEALGGPTVAPVSGKAAILTRERPTPTQTRMRGRRERAANVRDAFALGEGADVAGRRLLLIDDVFTTGATLNECARVLREAGAEGVWALAFARAELA